MEKDQEELLKDISSFLEKSKIPYMLTGAWNVIYFGRPRASHDIDFIVEINEKDAEKTARAFKKEFFDYILQEDAILDAISKRGFFNIVHLGTYLKVDFWMLKKNEFDESRFKRRIHVKLLGQEMCLATQEDTILQKLRWYKQAKIEKHLVDAAFVFQMQKEWIDFKYLNYWLKKLKVENFFKELDSIKLEDYL